MSYLERLKNLETGKNSQIMPKNELTLLTQAPSVSFVSSYQGINAKFFIDKSKLELFRFDLVHQDIEDGHPADELHRVNNMAWEFMQVESMAFDEAVKLAGKIVAHAQIAACEAAYIDVMALFKKVSQ
jgi:hypothetical protein